MFFSYGNTEPIQAGYKEVEGFKNFFVSCKWDADRFRNKALELMDQGKHVVIGYERMAIGGSEGYVTLMVKEPMPAKVKETRGRVNALQTNVWIPVEPDEQEKVHSLCLPYYDRADRYVSYFDLDGKEHQITPDKFKDVTTDGGRFIQFYTFRVEGGRKRRDSHAA